MGMFARTKTGSEDYWPSISDLMSGLMLVFLLIAIAYMYNVEQGKQRTEKVAITYKQTQVDLYESLMAEFEEDLPKWKAIIDKDTLSVSFLEPDVLFNSGSAEVTPAFKDILNDFFPRYLNILFSPKYESSIEEIRIEGHTSSEWDNGKAPKDVAYFHNMALSQDRTRSVLKYCYLITNDADRRTRMRQYVTANGLSSSQLVKDGSGRELKGLSRRVEFRTRTNAEQKIVQILREIER
jgi:outer membrane protein OmpA-like peptidoglycan-associated protein